MADYFLKNAEVVLPEGVFFKNLLISDGKILEILEPGEKADKKFKEIDLKGKVILPGLIDVHVHFREPGAAYKEDWESGSKAAVSGGVTTVFDMPNNAPPVVDVATLEAKRKLIEGRSYVNYGLYIGFNGENVDEINAAKNIPGVKFYASDSTGNMGVKDWKLVEKFFGECKKLIVVHAEDPQVIEDNQKAYLAEFEGRNIDPSVHSKIRSPEAAAIMVRKICELVKKTCLPDRQAGAKVHIAHLSTEQELEILAEYQDLPITCEVAPHHLLLSEDDYESLGNFIKMNPPVRSRNDIFALWKGIKFGEIDVVATDHAPHTLVEKEQGYLEAPSGVPGVDMLLPILLNTVNAEGLDLNELVALCCSNPAEIFGVPNKGKIVEGYDADLVVVDMELEKKVEGEKSFSKCKWSPYEGLSFKGWPIMTFVNGELLFKDGKIVGERIGKEINFE